MNWNDYVNSLQRSNLWAERLNIRLPGYNEKISIPSIITTSISLVDNVILAGYKKIIIVLPEKSKLAFMFIIAKIVKDIINGNNEKKYDIHEFVTGEKLKYENCIVQFERIDTDKSTLKERMYVNFSDLYYGVPIEIAPFFQKTDSRFSFTIMHR